MPPVHPRIFLSSTYIDLRNLRAEVIRWLTGIFGASLIVMETSGSDAAPPDVMSIRRVRQCDIFVGIYGHRYGTIDPITGKSKRWSHFVRQPVKVDLPIQRTNHHEDAETVFG